MITITAKEITVPESIDSSTSLQKLIDSTGNTPTKFIFSPDHDIEINSLLRFYNYTELAGNNCYFHLMENAPLNPFAQGIGIMAPKYPTAAEGLILHDFRYDGARDNQKYVSALYKKPWGNNFHNMFFLGYYGCINYSHAKYCSIYNVDYQNSLGDCVRGEGISDFTAHDIKIHKGGHDGVYIVAENADVYNISGVVSSNSAVRTRSSHSVKIHGVKVNNSDKLAYAPMIQIQSTAKDWTSKDIEIYDCELGGSYGPGIQIAANSLGVGNGLVSIHNNLFTNCGQMPTVNKLPYTGAIMFNGHDVDIYNNTFDKNYGYGICAGNYNVGNKNSYKATVLNNVVTDTTKALCAGTASGAGIADLLGTYTWSCSENDVYGNLTNLYKIINQNGLCVDPLYNTDYTLKAGSPCASLGFSGSSTASSSDSTSTSTVTSSSPSSTSTTATTPISSTESDVKNVYSSIATDITKGLEPSFTIKANSKTIRLDLIALAIATQKTPYVATCRITAQQAGGSEVVLKDWATKKVQYPTYSKAFSRAFAKGKDVTIRFYLKTSNAAIRAYLKNVIVKYTLL